MVIIYIIIYTDTPLHAHTYIYTNKSMATNNGSSTLARAVINLNSLRDDANIELAEILDSVAGAKCLVLDPCLGGPLNLVVTEGPKMFQAHGVENFIELGWRKLSTKENSIVYVVRPRITCMKQIANHIRSHVKEHTKKKYSVVFVPRRSFLCEKVLKDEGVYANISISEYHLGLIPFDDDVLSLELPNPISEPVLDKDNTMLYTMARSLMDLQTLYGVIPVVRGKGYMSKIVIELMLRLRKEEGDHGDHGAIPDIDSLLVLDRMVDPVSPLCTPLTYEGLIDELIGIQNTYVKIDISQENKDSNAPRSVPGAYPDTPWLCQGCMWKNKPNKIFCSVCGLQRPQQGVTSPVPLNSNDQLYAEVRNTNIGVLLPKLSQRASEMSQLENSREQMESLDEIHRFVKDLPMLQANKKSLKRHIDLTEKLQVTTNSMSFKELWQVEQEILEGKQNVQYIEDSIAREEPLAKVLRIVCMHSLCCGGFRPAKLDQIRREILQTYGYEFMFTLDNLERMGYFSRTPYWEWRSLARTFSLCVDEVEVHNPNNMAYVTSGYAPLSGRIVESMIRMGWGETANAIRGIPGPAVDTTQSRKKVGVVEPNNNNLNNSNNNDNNMKRKVLLVCVLGGITHMEIAALRLLKKDSRFDIIIASTKVINGKSFVKSLIDNPRIDGQDMLL